MNIKRILTVLVITVAISCFCGFMTSVAGGAIFPPINQIASPFVCPGGNMQADQKTYSQLPGQTVTTVTWYCVDGKSGTRNEIPMLEIGLFAIPLYAMILFIPVLVIAVLWAVLIAPKSAQRQQQLNLDRAVVEAGKQLDAGKINRAQYDQAVQNEDDFHAKRSGHAPARQQANAADAEDEKSGLESENEEMKADLKALKDMLDAGLISLQDYESKKAEILGRL